MNLSKSKYVEYCNCPKSLWLEINKPELKVEDSFLESLANEGNEVGDLARNYFGSSTNVLTTFEDGKLDYNSMLSKTQECIKNGTENICEASFSINGCYCQVDILHKIDGGYEIYEVKSTKYDGKKIAEKYINDISFQKQVLENCGIKILNTYLLLINRNFVKNGEIDVKDFFVAVNVNDLVTTKLENIEEYVENAKNVLALKDEPVYELNDNCKKCSFFDYCTKDIKRPCVFDIGGLTGAVDMYNKGIVTIEQTAEKVEGKTKNGFIKAQLRCLTKNQDLIVDKPKVNEFLATVRFPLYFLDFETFKTAIPMFDGLKPSQNVPFQYSLHYYKDENKELKHVEFLVEKGKNPTYEISKSLVTDIPLDACVVVYNKGVEPKIMRDLAKIHPEFSTQLNTIADNCIDLMEVFRNGYVYYKSMGGKFSIKSVLPAMYPKDKSVDYHSLEDVQNGGDAITAFKKLQTLSGQEEQKLRTSMLKYCCLDTLAMALVLTKLYEFRE